MDQNLINTLLTRRSARPAMLAEPGPSADQLSTILTVAARVPDHKKLAPWRFIVFQGVARSIFGEHLAEICQREENAPPSEVRLETERSRLLRAPIVVAVISSINRDRAVPENEQILSAGAACMNLCHAANAMGFGTSWITEWYAYSSGVRQVLALSENESIAGFIYIGTATETQPDRERPMLASVVQYWNG